MTSNEQQSIIHLAAEASSSFELIPFLGERTASPEIMRIPINSLRPADSPRIAGENHEHTELLARCDAPLPPVIVHRPSMRVIDGMHRVEAARLRHEDHVEVRFFEGTDQEAFVLGVISNITHGRPLTLKDRKAAARRILVDFPGWSDRAVASVTGLSHGTVATVRRSSGRDHHLNGRLGRDGKVRPIENVSGRRAAAELIKADENASLRSIASRAGVSVATVKDVRARLANGLDPVLAQRHNGRRGDATSTAWTEDSQAQRQQAMTELLARLRADPALKFNENGRNLLRLLSGVALVITDTDRLSQQAPPHCAAGLASFANLAASSWQEIAHRIERANRPGSNCG